MTYVSPSDAPRFSWKCSYQGSIWFQAWDHTGVYEIELRCRAEDYERKCYNGDDADWQRNVVAMIGVARRAYLADREIPTSTLQAFNAWRLAEHEKHMTELRGNPERYGTDFSDIKPPALARAAAVYQDGWIITGEANHVAS